MKAVFLFVLVCVLAAVSQSKYCGGPMLSDPSACTHSCPTGEKKACEHGGICTCAVGCALREQCINVTCASMRNPMTGQMMREEAHCFDGTCMCMRPYGPQPSGSNGGVPGEMAGRRYV